MKLGKNRTEADLRRYIDERDRLEKEREEVRSSLANLKKEKREAKEELSACQGSDAVNVQCRGTCDDENQGPSDTLMFLSDPKQQAALEACLKQKEEACKEAEHHRVEVELRLVEVKESLKKVESGPFTLGTTLDSSLQDTPTVSEPPRSQRNSALMERLLERGCQTCGLRARISPLGGSIWPT